MTAFKVLLVDDEQEFIEKLSERLKMRELATKWALDGEGALESLQDDEPDVMLLDLKMPGISGMEVLRKVKKAYPGIQVVILSGHGTDEHEEQTKRLGAYAYLQKPVALDRLAKILREAFESSSAGNLSPPG